MKELKLLCFIQTLARRPSPFSLTPPFTHLIHLCSPSHPRSSHSLTPLSLHLSHLLISFVCAPLSLMFVLYLIHLFSLPPHSHSSHSLIFLFIILIYSFLASFIHLPPHLPHSSHSPSFTSLLIPIDYYIPLVRFILSTSFTAFFNPLPSLPASFLLVSLSLTLSTFTNLFTHLY